MKKFLALLLALVMVMSMAACGEKENPAPEVAPEATPEAAPEAAPEASEEPIEISYNTYVNTDVQPDNMVETYIEEKLNIKLTVPQVDISDATQLQLLKASGELPECGWQWGDGIGNYEEGLTRTISEEMIRQYAPNYAALLDSDPIGWELNKAPNGEYYALSGYDASNIAKVAWVAAFNLDWLEAVGIEPNGEMVALDDAGTIMMCAEPFTQSQFEEIMEAFTYGDPDGNGVNDTYGMTAAGAGGATAWSFANMYSMFNVISPDWNVAMEENGENNVSFATESYKEMIAWMNEMYGAGYIDPEYATLDNWMAWEKFGTQKVGFSNTVSMYLGYEQVWAHNRAPMNLVMNGGRILVTPTLVADDGTGGSYPYNVSTYKYPFSVRADVSDEKLAKILEFFDYTCFPGDDYMYLHYGEEGVHYTKEDNAAPIAMEGINQAEYGINIYGTTYLDLMEYVNIRSAPETVKVNEWCMDLADTLIWPDYWDPSSATKISSLYNECTSLYPVANEWFFKFMVGDADIETQWEEYISALEGAGYDEIRAEWQNATPFIIPER